MSFLQARVSCVKGPGSRFTAAEPCVERSTLADVIWGYRLCTVTLTPKSATFTGSLLRTKHWGKEWSVLLTVVGSWRRRASERAMSTWREARPHRNAQTGSRHRRPRAHVRAVVRTHKQQHRCATEVCVRSTCKGTRGLDSGEAGIRSGRNWVEIYRNSCWKQCWWGNTQNKQRWPQTLPFPEWE